MCAYVVWYGNGTYICSTYQMPSQKKIINRFKSYQHGRNVKFKNSVAFSFYIPINVIWFQKYLNIGRKFMLLLLLRYVHHILAEVHTHKARVRVSMYSICTIARSTCTINNYIIVSHRNIQLQTYRANSISHKTTCVDTQKIKLTSPVINWYTRMVKCRVVKCSCVYALSNKNLQVDSYIHSFNVYFSSMILSFHKNIFIINQYIAVDRLLSYDSLISNWKMYIISTDNQYIVQGNISKSVYLMLRAYNACISIGHVYCSMYTCTKCNITCSNK